MAHPVCHSGTTMGRVSGEAWELVRPESMRNVDGFINKDESVPRFLSLVGDFVKRYWE